MFSWFERRQAEKGFHDLLATRQKMLETEKIYAALATVGWKQRLPDVPDDQQIAAGVVIMAAKIQEEAGLDKTADERHNARGVFTLTAADHYSRLAGFPFEEFAVRCCIMSLLPRESFDQRFPILMAAHSREHGKNGTFQRVGHSIYEWTEEPTPENFAKMVAIMRGGVGLDIW